MNVYTIGHYNHSKGEFLTLIGTKDIDCVVDVRSMPGSNRNPHFNKQYLQEWLEEASIRYVHLPRLGGRRSRSGEVGQILNEGWKNNSFHHYADYSLTEGFQQGIDDLKSLISEYQLVIMCAELHPSRCHRLIISNYLQANGYDVTHILSDAEAKAEFVEHQLGKWGAPPVIEEDGTVVYPSL